MDFRLAIFKLIITFGFLIILGKLFSLTIIGGQYYRNLSGENRIRETKIFADRGIIYDRNNEPLVINAPIFINKTNEIVTKNESLSDPDVRIISGRKYLLNDLSGHFLGYVSLKDRKGIGGIEEFYNNKLMGVDGKKLTEVDAKGEIIRELGQIPAKSGLNLKINIDKNLQEISARAFGSKKGAVVITNYETGEILALYSGPSFDPNLFTMPGGDNWEQRVQKVLTDKDLLMFDRAIAGTYPPGSTFKIISAAAGLESGSITAETKFEDTGVLIIGPYKFPNWKWLKNGGVEGWINIIEALQKSNDIFFYQVGGKTGIDGLENMAKKFGLTKTLGIDLPNEAAGVFRTDREWFLGDTYHTVIGQGEILVTPLQVNSWTATIANNGVFCKPNLIKNINCKSLNLKSETISLIKRGMRAACIVGGTAYPLFDLKKVIYCKTGTAEFGDPQNRTHAWLTGFLDDPKIAITVLVEAGGEGSDVAAPVVKEIIEKWL